MYAFRMAARLWGKNEKAGNCGAEENKIAYELNSLTAQAKKHNILGLSNYLHWDSHVSLFFSFKDNKKIKKNTHAILCIQVK